MKRKREASAVGLPEKKHVEKHRTIKLGLKNLLNHPAHVLPILNETVVKCHELVTEVHQFIRLYALHKYHANAELPLIDKKFIMNVLRTVGKTSNRGRPDNSAPELKEELQAFILSSDYQDSGCTPAQEGGQARSEAAD